ncbi:MAG: hypothetical protein U5R48_12310 [Gammaproteobacteria bacterium]|nr:hypothetical protein [Gammaproteobacteria bacterium]
MNVPWVTCKKRLATLWFSGAGFIFVIFLMQTIGGRHGANPEAAWGWLLPTLMPTLSLMVGVFVLDTLGKGANIKMVEPVHVPDCVWAFSDVPAGGAGDDRSGPFSAMGASALMTQSNLWLGPFQGLVSGALGAFFIRGEPA